jgi:hypothetical protein
MTEEQKKEAAILMALFKATIEQSSYLTGVLNQKPKQVFNDWQKRGVILLNEMEKHKLIDLEYLEKITDIYHNINLEIRRN